MTNEEKYENLIETLELLSIPGFKEDLDESCAEIKAGETLSFEEVFGESFE